MLWHNEEPRTYRIEPPWPPYRTRASTIQYTSLHHTVHESPPYRTRASTIQYTSLHHTEHEPPQYSTRASTIQNTSLHHTVHESLQYRTNCFQHWCMCLKKKFYSFFQHGCRGFPHSSGRTRNKTLSYTDDLRKFQKKNNFLVFYIVEYIWIFICFEINTVSYW